MNDLMARLFEYYLQDVDDMYLDWDSLTTYEKEIVGTKERYHELLNWIVKNKD